MVMDAIKDSPNPPKAREKLADEEGTLVMTGNPRSNQDGERGGEVLRPYSYQREMLEESLKVCQTRAHAMADR